MVFDHSEWRKPENQNPFVRDDDKAGYEFNEESTLTIVSTLESESQISALLAKIPHSANFYKAIVLSPK